MTRRWLFHQAARLSALPFAGSLAVATPEPEAEPERREPAPHWLDELEAAAPISMCFELHGVAYELVRWSELQWRDLPEEDRPDDDDVMTDSSNGQFLIRRIDDDETEHLSPDLNMAVVFELETARKELHRRGRARDRRRVASALRRCRRLAPDLLMDLLL